MLDYFLEESFVFQSSFIPLSPLKSEEKATLPGSNGEFWRQIIQFGRINCFILNFDIWSRCLIRSLMPVIFLDRLERRLTVFQLSVVNLVVRFS